MIFFSLIVTLVLGAEIICGGTAGEKLQRPAAGTPGGGARGGGPGGGEDEEEKEEEERRHGRKSRTFTRGEEVSSNTCSTFDLIL